MSYPGLDVWVTLDMSITQLSSGQYIDTGRSRWLPITAQDATRWLVEDDTDDTIAWESRVRAWAEMLPRQGEGRAT